MFWHSVMAQRSCLPSGAHLSCKDSLSTAVKRWGRKGLRSLGKLFTCHHLLGLIWFHVTVILSCHFFRTGLRAASLLRIKRVRIVLEDDELQKRGGGGGGGGDRGKGEMDGRRETATARMHFAALLSSATWVGKTAGWQILRWAQGRTMWYPLRRTGR